MERVAEPTLAPDELTAAFDRGDFAQVRRDVPRLISSPQASPEVKAAAIRLLERTRPDPLSYIFFVLTGLLLAALSGYWWWRAGGVSGG